MIGNNTEWEKNGQNIGEEDRRGGYDRGKYRGGYIICVYNKGFGRSRREHTPHYSLVSLTSLYPPLFLHPPYLYLM